MMIKHFSFLKRVNQAVSRYMKVIYDERRNQVVALMRVPAKQAKTLLNKESLAILMFIFITKKYCRMNIHSFPN